MKLRPTVVTRKLESLCKQRKHVDDTHSLLDCYVMSLCFPYINANFKHRSGRNILRDMSFSRGNARTLGVHRHADLEEIRLEKDKPNEKTESTNTRITSFFALFPVLNITLTDSFQISVFYLFYLFIYKERARGR